MFGRRELTIERNVRLKELNSTPGGSLRLDYAYRNGVRRYFHAVPLFREFLPVR
jgi:hypothetical protein